MKHCYTIVILIGILAFPQLSIAIEEKPALFNTSGITEKIGTKIPLKTTLTQSNGKKVTLDDILKEKKPIILNFVYYHCPMLCNLLADGIQKAVQQLDPKTNSKYSILTVSMDHSNTIQQAKNFKEKYTQNQSSPNWRFTIGSEETIQLLTQTTGFNFNKLKNNSDFAHSAALMIINKEGIITRYLYGIQFKPFDIKLAVLESKQPSKQTILEKTLLFCYSYNPDENSYALKAIRVMQITGTLFAFLILLVIITMIKKESNIEKE